MRNNKYLFIFTLLYFLLGLVNIHLALLGVFCMLIPFILLLRDRKKTWCTGYCPRAAFYSMINKQKKRKVRTLPKFIVNGNLKDILVIYFILNISFVTMSTIGVATGKIFPMEYLRFLIVFPIPFRMPQLIGLANFLPWLTHLSYRIYSMMMTATVLGLIMSKLYKSRSWCVVCPIGALSDRMLKNNS